MAELQKPNRCWSRQQDIYCEQTNTYSQTLYCVCEKSTALQTKHGRKNWTRRNSLTSMISPGRPVQFHSHIFFRPHSDPNHKRNSFILGIHRTVISKEESCSCRCLNDIEGWMKDNQQTCIANATEFTEHAKQFEFGHWCFCEHEREKSLVSQVLEQTKRNMGSHRKENDTEV